MTFIVYFVLSVACLGGIRIGFQIGLQLRRWTVIVAIVATLLGLTLNTENSVIFTFMEASLYAFAIGIFIGHFPFWLHDWLYDLSTGKFFGDYS